ncbi:hypothetical protein EZV73_03815 [Acidaminobacter sp. JC074]|uniref:DUF1648 domain-containing protein n=1 Tax=Acidaminobacter sp. JC074 TaxID=2530199 RepID=UPI001F0E8D29|nr:DUF5808 domain-containing protein [Acidaminobacter sp. JC074]MCH4886678.1 hypothetical protein [Acidaminobacter sp. JC074]
MAEITFIIVQVVMLLSFLMLPYISRKDVMFGVTMPTSAFKDEAVVSIRKRFLILSFIFGLIMIVLQWTNNHEKFLLMMLPVTIVGYSAVYVYAYNLMKQLKKSKDYKVVSTKTVIDTKFRSRGITVPGKWYLAYLVIFIISALVSAFKYDSLPDLLVIQTNSSGQDMMAKGPAILYLLGMQVFVYLLMIGVQYAIKHAKQELSNQDTQASIKRNVNFRYRFSVILYVMGLLMGITFLMTLFFTLGIIIDAKLLLAATLILTFIPVVIILIYSLKYRQDGSKDADESDFIEKDDDRFWKLGMFYFNKNDPSIIVAKRAGIGWTINHSRWQAWAFYVIVIATIILAIYFGG